MAKVKILNKNKNKIKIRNKRVKIKVKVKIASTAIRRKGGKKIPKIKKKKLKLRKINKKITFVVRNKEVKLERSLRNPIISPRLYEWESKATFNPTAFVSNGKVHLIYRAIGNDDVSVLGYASSYDGYHIEERLSHFIYKRFNENFKEGKPLIYSSGGGWNGGCEDPRVTLIGDTVYMLYTAFDGWHSVRIALTSIKLSDFKNKKWNWEKSVLISPPGEIHKNWVLFPEKIFGPTSGRKGKFAILHSFYPEILIEYFDSLDDFDGNKFIKSNNTRPVDKKRVWDSWFRGVGPSPIKIKEGWLILYHAMDHKNTDKYRLGALILDLKNPQKVLYRSNGPILEPEEHYENNGHKGGVVYSCGAIVKENRLFVYYGGADTVVCVASIKIEELVKDLKQNKTIKLKKNKLIKFK